MVCGTIDPSSILGERTRRWQFTLNYALRLNSGFNSAWEHHKKSKIKNQRSKIIRGHGVNGSMFVSKTNGGCSNHPGPALEFLSERSKD